MIKAGYLIDMDGVIYRENNLIPGAAEFVAAL
jgi:ribonucleotide monophosphatase NagD (HAD superfamily)